eukprot:5588568-Prymnesium_polylepis.1
MRPCALIALTKSTCARRTRAAHGCGSAQLPTQHLSDSHVAIHTHTRDAVYYVGLTGCTGCKGCAVAHESPRVASTSDCDCALSGLLRLTSLRLTSLHLTSLLGAGGAAHTWKASQYISSVS